MTTTTVEQLIAMAGAGIHDERIAAAASAIKPGHLIEITTADEVQEHSTAAANAAKLIALTNLANSSDIDTAYTVGESVRFACYGSGQEVVLRLAAAATAVTIGAALESDGNGTVRILTTDAATDDTQRDSVVAYALEAVDNSGGASEVLIKARIA